MRLLTLIAGYAAGLAVAMKYRKDSGTSKLSTDSKQSKIDAFIDEIVDIHKSAYKDVRSTVNSTWEEVENLDGLKKKVMTLVTEFTDEIELKIAELRAHGEIRAEVITKAIDDSLTEKEAVIESARAKSLTFKDEAIDTIDTFLTDATKKLQVAHNKLKTKIKKELP